MWIASLSLHENREDHDQLGFLHSKDCGVLSCGRALKRQSGAGCGPVCYFRDPFRFCPLRVPNVTLNHYLDHKELFKLRHLF